MSQYKIQAREPEKYNVTVGWDRHLQTFFAGVFRNDEGKSWNLDFWVGRRPLEINVVRELQEKIKDYADIPKDIQGRLEWEGKDIFQRLGVKAEERPMNPIDKRALTAYHFHCDEVGKAPTVEEAQVWVQKWRVLDAELIHKAPSGFPWEDFVDNFRDFSSFNERPGSPSERYALIQGREPDAEPDDDLER